MKTNTWLGIPGLNGHRPKGQIIILTAAAVVVIFAFAAMAIDFGLMYLTKAKLSRSVDSLGLRLAGNITTDNMSNARIALETIKANYHGFLSDVHWDDATTNVVPASAMSISTPSEGTTIINISNAVNNLVITNSATFFPANNPICKVVNVSAGASTKHYPYFLPILGQNFNNIGLSEKATARRVPTIVCLILDISGSMRGNSGWQNLPSAVTNFVANFKNSQSQDFMSVITFSSYASLRWPTNYIGDSSGYPTNMIPSTNFVDPINAFMTNPASGEGIRFGGSTCGQEGLRLGYKVVANLLGNIPEDQRKDLRVFYILFTDGTFNTSRVYAKGPSYNTIHPTNTVPWFHKELVINCNGNDFSPYTAAKVADSTNSGFSTTSYNLNSASRFGNYVTVTVGTNTFSTNLSWTNRAGISATIQNQSAKTSFAQWSNINTSSIIWPSPVPIRSNATTTTYSTTSTTVVSGNSNTSYGGTNWNSANGYQAWTNQFFSAYNTLWNPTTFASSADNTSGFTNVKDVVYWAAVLANFQHAYDITMNVPDMPIYDISTNLTNLSAASGPYNWTMASTYPSSQSLTTRKLANYPGGRFYANTYNTYFENPSGSRNANNTLDNNGNWNYTSCRLNDLYPNFSYGSNPVSLLTNGNNITNQIGTVGKLVNFSETNSHPTSFYSYKTTSDVSLTTGSGSPPVGNLNNAINDEGYWLSMMQAWIMRKEQNAKIYFVNYSDANNYLEKRQIANDRTGNNGVSTGPFFSDQPTGSFYTTSDQATLSAAFKDIAQKIGTQLTK